MILWSINEMSLNTATGLQYSIITTYQLWPPLAPQTDHYDHLAKRQQICYRLEMLCIKEAIIKAFWGRCGIMLHAFNSEMSEFPWSYSYLEKGWRPTTRKLGWKSKPQIAHTWKIKRLISCEHGGTQVNVHSQWQTISFKVMHRYEINNTDKIHVNFQIC